MKNLNLFWIISAIFITSLILIPIFVIIAHLPFIDMDTLSHLGRFVLPRYIFGSVILLFGVLALTLILGISTAYLIAFYDFFGRKVFEIALILPLAIPAYIMGFAWVALCEFEGVIPTLLGVESRIDIMNPLGAIIILSFALYPYIYFFVKNNFTHNLGTILLSAQSLSASNVRIFWRVVLPFSRISIVGALMLVLMETLSEYGLVAYFGVDSFSAGIFRTWLGGGDKSSGIALSAVLVIFVFVLLALESYQRKNRSYAQSTFLPTPRQRLRTFGNALAFLWCAIVLFFAFIVPFAWLLFWGFYDIANSFPKFTSAMIYSLVMSLSSAFVIVAIAFFLCFIVRLGGGRISKVILTLANLGYAIPGAVVAIGILLFLGFINAQILNPLNIAYALGGGFLVLFFGYLVRFLASGIFATQGGFAKIPQNFDFTALNLKATPTRIFTQIHFPLIRSSLALAFVIVAIDILKELPISTILASSGYQTLSAAAFGYSDNEQIYDAALPSLLIVLFALIPTLLMHFLHDSGAKNNDKVAK